MEFIYLLKDDAIFAASNTENEGEDSTTHAISAIDGLVAGHAYSMLECREVHVGHVGADGDGKLKTPEGIDGLGATTTLKLGVSVTDVVNERLAQLAW